MEIAKKSVVIVEDNAGLCAQLTSLLEQAPDLECLYTVDSAEQAIERIPQRPPDVVLMDIRLPGMSGIDCVAELKKSLPNLEIVMLTIYQDEESIFRALKAGASGYLIKSSDPESLYAAIRDVHSGGVPFSSLIARKVVQFFQEGEGGGGPTGKKKSVADEANLTSREREVLELMASGYRYREIAAKLFVSLETVRTHVKHICAKMHVRSRVEVLVKLRAAR